MPQILTRRPGRASISCIVFFLLLVASSACGQDGFNPNTTGGTPTSTPRQPKSFLTAKGVATAGKFKISITSVEVGPARSGQDDRLLVRFVAKNTDPKKRLPLGKFNPAATDDGRNICSADMLDVPREIDAGEEARFFIAIGLPGKKAKSVRLVLADGVGWELKRAEWEKAP